MTINKVERDVFGKTISLETGLLAREADGSVVVRLGESMVLAAATMAATPRPDIDFFPLMVDFEEKFYAAGKIPGGFFKREGRPSEKAILTSRMVDRPLRPLFPEGLLNDVQVVITSLSADQINPLDILGINGASAALTISEIPFNGPIGAVRVGYVDGQYVANPTYADLAVSTLDLIIAGTADGKILMVEVISREVSEKLVADAIEFSFGPIRAIIELQKELAAKVGKAKKSFEPYKIQPEIYKFVSDKFGKRVADAMHISEKDKQQAALELIDCEIKEQLMKPESEALKKIFDCHTNDIKMTLKKIQKAAVRATILNDGRRPDGRGFEDIRELSAMVGLLPRVHGSGLFSRGGTQVLTVATLGSVSDEQIIDGLGLEDSKRYMHHYNFPAYSVGEVRPLRGAGRREIGHGALAEKALLPVIPSDLEFPYTIRLVSEVMGSNGSTSMASTCGSTLALMDAGVPIKEPVTGISIGLVKEGNKYTLLTDIQGLEDFFGDMDFKVTRTRNGITAIQLDVKTHELDLKILTEALEKSRLANAVILKKILSVLPAPRADLSPYAPRVTVVTINVEKIGELIGPGGKNIKKIIEETGAKIDIEDDGRVFIFSNDPEAQAAAIKRVKDITCEVEVGQVYEGEVVRIMNFGAFVALTPSKDGLVHISQLSSQRVARVEDVVKIGDRVKVRVSEIDDLGRINLTMKNVS